MESRAKLLGHPIHPMLIVLPLGSAGFMDRYVARNGYDSQQTDEPADPDRADNLWEPLPGDRGAHGRFGDSASPSSPQFWLTTHRTWVLLASGLGALASTAMVRRLR